MPRLVLPLLALLAALPIAGCETLGLSRKDPAAERAARLRLPPDLNATGINDRMAIPGMARADERPPQATLEREGDRPQLVLQDGFYEAWRRVGLAVDRLGFTLEDRNRAEGQYFIRYDPEAEQTRREKGFLESLAFWRDEPDRLALYVVQLRQSDGRTVVTVTNEAGEPAPADVAERILALLHEQLR